MLTVAVVTDIVTTEAVDAGTVVATDAVAVTVDVDVGAAIVVVVEASVDETALTTIVDVVKGVV